jgi:hypothetical protein
LRRVTPSAGIAIGATIAAEVATLFWAVWGAVFASIGRAYWRTGSNFMAVFAIFFGFLAIAAAMLI